MLHPAHPNTLQEDANLSHLLDSYITQSCITEKLLKAASSSKKVFLLQVIVTNTIPTHPDRLFPELTVLSVANLLGETIWRVYNSSSVQSLL